MSTEATSTATETTATESAAAETESTLVTGAEVTETTEASAETSETEAQAETTEAETSEAETEKVEGAPEEYADFTMPEGIELDTELTDQFKATAKELNLTQDQAQKVIELGAAMRQRDAEAIVALREDWITQTKSDPEIGGDKLDATLATAKRAVSAYGSQQFIDLLNQSGLGNHPEVVRFMANVGKTVAEDNKVVTNGNPNPTGHQSLAGRLFGGNKDKE